MANTTMDFKVMDKHEAIKIDERYLAFVGKKYPVENAWWFGSFAKVTNHEDSDMGLAIIFKTIDDVIDMQIELLKMQTENGLSIEPYPFRMIDFKAPNPVVSEILKNEVEIKFFVSS